MDDKTPLDLLDSLSREMAAGFDRMDSGFQRVEARLGRQGGIINGGTRQVARLVEWSEKVDTILADRDKVIADLKQRLEKLEGKN